MNKKKIRFIPSNSKEEKQIVNFTKKNLNWLKRNSYQYTLPKGEHSHDEKLYLRATKKIELSWKNQEKDFFTRVESLFGKNDLGSIKVHISMYGVGGSYMLPNHIYINSRLPYDVVENIKHEIIHLIIEPFVQRFNLDHKKKEDLVTALLCVLSPDSK